MATLYYLKVDSQDDLYELLDEMVGDIATLVKHSDGRTVTPYTDDWETFYARMEAMMSSEGLPDMKETDIGRRRREYYTAESELV